MGGQLFPVNCPRMPPDVYHKVAADMTAKLEVIFLKVTIPREMPGKRDFGDVDFLVTNEIPSDTSLAGESTRTRIGNLIGAQLSKTNGGTFHFAIPHPVVPNAYVQVDVELSPGQGTPDSEELFEWTRFLKSDSDLLQIIGICHRGLGLTMNEKGLHLRVAEIEPYNKKKSLLFLTRHPDQVMEFYGLDSSEYHAGFDAEDELFDWVTRGRFFSRHIFDDRVEKSNDRARQIKRPMYRKFVEEYMPSHSDVGTSDRQWTRSEILVSGLETFGKQDEYDKMMREHKTQEADAQLWKQVKESLPLEGEALNLVVRGLKRWVQFIEGQPHISDDANLDTESQPIWIEAIDADSGHQDALLLWIRDHWAKVKTLEKTRVVSLCLSLPLFVKFHSCQARTQKKKKDVLPLLTCMPFVG
ncbi:hypothetical protein K504DRAFT_486017 [Pleomassaria siparia CBS 279.74]|uniref:Uncharacterized protein n=1 Tax=Pleomassaria siparia CBS 279.74 TaxID=1314801 RepID=A0A6G1JR90_9PLEO|nr:hypothetical protein K504DRAFT_486017 [Pleomassaria siparia CBS 279.74]